MQPEKTLTDIYTKIDEKPHLQNLADKLNPNKAGLFEGISLFYWRGKGWRGVGGGGGEG